MKTKCSKAYPLISENLLNIDDMRKGVQHEYHDRIELFLSDCSAHLMSHLRQDALDNFKLQIITRAFFNACRLRHDVGTLEECQDYAMVFLEEATNKIMGE